MERPTDVQIGRDGTTVCMLKGAGGIKFVGEGVRSKFTEKQAASSLVSSLSSLFCFCWAFFFCMLLVCLFACFFCVCVCCVCKGASVCVSVLCVYFSFFCFGLDQVWGLGLGFVYK